MRVPILDQACLAGLSVKALPCVVVALPQPASESRGPEATLLKAVLLHSSMIRMIPLMRVSRLSLSNRNGRVLQPDMLKIIKPSTPLSYMMQLVQAMALQA